MADLGFGISSYQRYKTGTAKFTSWLAEASQRCGQALESFGNLASPVTKKKKKAGKSGGKKPPPKDTKYTIPVRRFIDLAEAIANSKDPKVEVPRSILTLLNDVISLRKEVATVRGNSLGSRGACHDQDHDHDQESDEGHRYFILILERVRELLRPLTEKSTTQGSEPSASEEKLVNIFEALEIEEPAESVINAPEIRKSTTVTRASPRKTYDIETYHDEVLLSSLFFFRDLAEIRVLVQLIWEDYRATKVDLITASLVTNTAIEIVQRNLKEQLELMSKWDESPDEAGWIRWVYAHICPGADINHRELPNDDINFQIYDTAEYVCLPVSYHVQDFFEANEEHRHQLTFVKPNPNQSINPSLPRELYQADQIYVEVILTELKNAKRVLQDFPPGLDALTQAICFDKILEGKTAPLWVTFAVQIIVDTHHTIEHESSRPFTELRVTGQRIKGTIQAYQRFSTSIESRKHGWHKNNDGEINKLSLFISEWLESDPVIALIEKYSSRDPVALGASLQQFSMFKAHPLLCGSIMYWLELSLQEFSISLSNCYDSILVCGHLYNAARQMGLYQDSWKDMEFLIKCHTPQRLFVGEPPKRQEDFLKRFNWFWVSVLPTLGRIGEISKCADRPQICATADSERPVQSTTFSGTVAEEHPDFDHIAGYADQWRKTRKLKSSELLTILGVALTDENIHLRFDYISMHIKCATFLMGMRDRFIASSEYPQSVIEAPEHQGWEGSAALIRMESTGSPLSAYLRGQAMRSDNLGPAVVRSIFMANPISAAAVSSLIPLASSQVEMLRAAHVSLERASGWLDDNVRMRGDEELKKANALCRFIKN